MTTRQRADQGAARQAPDASGGAIFAESMNGGLAAGWLRGLPQGPKGSQLMLRADRRAQARVA